jgi:hypothetical protein
VPDQATYLQALQRAEAAIVRRLRHMPAQTAYGLLRMFARPAAANVPRFDTALAFCANFSRAWDSRADLLRGLHLLQVAQVNTRRMVTAEQRATGQDADAE